MNHRQPRWVGATLIAISLLGDSFLTGCVSTPASPAAFTEEWIEENERVQRQRAEKSGELVLVGKDKRARAYVYTDEKGKPRLGVGGRGGISADLDLHDGEPSVLLKYKLRLGKKRTPRAAERQAPQPAAPEAPSSP